MNRSGAIPGIGFIRKEYEADFEDIPSASSGLWNVGKDGVVRILTPLDRKTEFIVFADKTLVCVKSAMGHPAIYQLPESEFKPPASAVLMDLDGTSVQSETFWIWAIERATARLLGNDSFKLDPADLPFVSGYSVSEHLKYCIGKYAPGRTIEEARCRYFEIVRHELRELETGRGRTGAFIPSPGLKEFLLALKQRNIKIGLVTSGLHEKAWPEVLSAFRTLDMGDPREFYDAIITAGTAFGKGQTGTLGELEPKPHPWLYAETATVGLGIGPDMRNRVVGIEDSGAGVVAIRLAGFAAIGISGGNIAAGGARPLLHRECNNLLECLPYLFGEA